MKTPSEWHNLFATEELNGGGPMVYDMLNLQRIAAIQSDAREGMVPAAELRPTIDIIKSLLLSADCSWYQSGGGHDWKGAVDVATSEIARLETLLGEKEVK